MFIYVLLLLCFLSLLLLQKILEHGLFFAHFCSFAISDSYSANHLCTHVRSAQKLSDVQLTAVAENRIRFFFSVLSEDKILPFSKHKKNQSDPLNVPAE